MAANQRTLWLGGVLVLTIVGALVARSMGTTPAAPSAAQARAAARAATRGPTAVPQGVGDVALELLDRVREEPSEGERNPFRFRPRVAAPPPPPVALPRPAPVAGVPGAPANPLRPAGPPPPPAITLKYIGYVTRADGTAIAVLSDGRWPLHGVEGQEVDGRYRILRISRESVEVSYLDGRGRQTIKLTGQ